MSNVFPPQQPGQAFTGNVEVSLPWNGDFTIASNGDLTLAFDLPGNAMATGQEVARLLYTNPRMSNGQGGYYSSGDDLFHPDWGVGLPARVGQMFPGGSAAGPISAALSNIKAVITKGLATLVSIAQNPAPTVSVTPDANPNQVDINVSCQAITGQIITVPARPISGGT